MADPSDLPSSTGTPLRTTQETDAIFRATREFQSNYSLRYCAAGRFSIDIGPELSTKSEWILCVDRVWKWDLTFKKDIKHKAISLGQCGPLTGSIYVEAVQDSFSNDEKSGNLAVKSSMVIEATLYGGMLATEFAVDGTLRSAKIGLKAGCLSPSFSVSPNASGAATAPIWAPKTRPPNGPLILR